MRNITLYSHNGSYTLAVDGSLIISRTGSDHRALVSKSVEGFAYVGLGDTLVEALERCEQNIADDVPIIGDNCYISVGRMTSGDLAALRGEVNRVKLNKDTGNLERLYGITWSGKRVFERVYARKG